METKIVKYTINDPEYIDAVANATTEVLNTDIIQIKGNKGTGIELKRPSKKLVKFLQDEGYDIQSYYGQKRQGIKTISNIPVKVKPRNHSNYNNGIFLWFNCEGETKEDLRADIVKKTQTIMGYFTKHRIPLDRICEELTPNCEYKL